MFISKEKYDELVSERDGLKEQNSSLQTENKSLKDENSKLKTETDVLLTDKTNLEGQLKGKEEELKTAGNKISKLEGENAELKKIPAEVTSRVISSKEASIPGGDKDKNITSDDKNFIENMKAVKDEYLK